MVKEQTLGRSLLSPQVQEGRRFNALTDKIGSFIVLELLPPKSGSVSLVTTSSWRSWTGERIGSNISNWTMSVIKIGTSPCHHWTLTSHFTMREDCLLLPDTSRVAFLGGRHLHTELPMGKIYGAPPLPLHRRENFTLASTANSRRVSHTWEWWHCLLCIVQSGWVPRPDSVVVQLDSSARTQSSWLKSQWCQRQTGRDTCWGQSQLGSCSYRNKRRQLQTRKECVEMGIREIRLGNCRTNILCKVTLLTTQPQNKLM